MNIRRGLFRLWIVLAAGWIIGSTWELRYDLFARCEGSEDDTIAEKVLGYPVDTKAASPDGLWVRCDGHNWQSAPNREAVERMIREAHAGENDRFLLDPTQIAALQWTLSPPIAAFVIGFLGLWIANGFRRPKSGLRY
jgi:hypothetical protein